MIADHARAVAFLIGDGVFPANDGRGYVLRRILRRAVRHAFLLGRTEPTLVHVVAKVIETMGGAFPELQQRAKLIVDTTRAEEERFLATIEGGMLKFEQLAPAQSTQGSLAIRGTISGEDAFKLYDTYGFPIDLTELMSRERGYTVDISGFERALAAQRDQSREERKTREIRVATDTLAEGGLAGWERAPGAKHEPQSTFVGYGNTNSETTVEAARRLDGGRIALILRETPFYAVSGGQISDKGEIVGQGWRVDVDDVRKIEGRTVTAGRLGGAFAFGAVHARVPADVRRDTERNHTATHLLHAALREVLGEHVHQQGSLVEPDRLRFDFTHHGPVKPAEQSEIELRVNRAIWDDIDVVTEEKPYKAAVASGAMALFGEKYGDVVRVVNVPGVSKELCGGTHARNTGQIALFKIVSESGVAAGVRRIEAVTGPKAYELVRAEEQRLSRLADLLKAPADAIEKRVATLRDDLRAMQKQLDEARKGGGDEVAKLLAGASNFQGHRVICDTASAADGKELQSLGDALREQLGSGVAWWDRRSATERPWCSWWSPTISRHAAWPPMRSCARSPRQPAGAAAASRTWRRPACPMRVRCRARSVRRHRSYVRRSTRRVRPRDDRRVAQGADACAAGESRRARARGAGLIRVAGPRVHGRAVPRRDGIAARVAQG